MLLFPLACIGDRTRRPPIEERLSRDLRYWGASASGPRRRARHEQRRGRTSPSRIAFAVPQLNISTACSSSASAISGAYRAIRNGDADVIVVRWFRGAADLYNLSSVAGAAGARQDGRHRSVAHVQALLGRSNRTRARRRRCGAPCSRAKSMRRRVALASTRR